jgi:ubiquitin C-terminal hydrolase
LNNKSDNFLFSLKHLLISLCNNNISYYSPDEFKKNLGLENKLFAGNNQYDSTIFNVSLLNIIHKKLNKAKKENFKKLDMSKYVNKTLKQRFEIWKANLLSKNQSFIHSFLAFFMGFMQMKLNVNHAKIKLNYFKQ